LSAYARALRLERWPRSAAIFIGSAGFFFLYRNYFSSFRLPSLLLRLALAFLLTWAISTVNYIINEIVDAPYDVHHPEKRLRPLIQGEIKKGPFLLLGIVLTAASFVLASAFFSRPFFLSLLFLLVAGFIYNLKPVRTKDIPFLDAISESANNPIRFLIGWYAFSPQNIFPPVSLLVCWWSFGNFLMEAKRLSEFRLLGDKAANYRLSHKRYSRNSLLLGMIASAIIFFLSFLYFALAFELRFFIYISPLLLVYLYLFIRKTLQEKEIMEEPESLLRNPLIAVFTFSLLLLLALAFFLD
jgi:decaprenyl-phosphate phosphoribosyltransferase